MSKSQMKQTFALFKKPGETFAAYYKAEVLHASEQLSYAVKNAAKDHDGKPVFYTICRHVSASGMSRTISVHYFDRETDSMRHLNYSAAVLLDRAQDRLRDGVICKGCGMDMGFDLAYALSCAATGDGYAVNHHWL